MLRTLLEGNFTKLSQIQYLKMSAPQFLFGYIFKEIQVFTLPSTTKYVILGSFSVFGSSYGSFQFKAFIWDDVIYPHKTCFR